MPPGGHTGNGSSPSVMTKPSMRCVRMCGLTLACGGRWLAGGGLLLELLTAGWREGGGEVDAASSADRITDLLDGSTGHANGKGGEWRHFHSFQTVLKY